MLFSFACRLALIRILAATKAPNIVFIIADDLGWNDVGYHGSDLRTPVLDELARSGLRLERHYTQPECSTTRASLLTGRYVVRTGLQDDVILNGGGMAVPLNETMMPEYLQELGYRNYLVGKWHLGANSRRETPLYRGWDRFYGYYGGQVHYFGHFHTKFGGHDFRRNYRDAQGTFREDILDELQGQYLTRLLTEEAVRVVQEHDPAGPMLLYFSLPNTHSPNQSPPGYPDRCLPDTGAHSYDRKQFAGNLAGLEESVANLTAALKSSPLWNDTLLIFLSDNGGSPEGLTSYGGQSNYPLRSGKTTQFEGALRTPAFVAGPLVEHLAGEETEGLFHVSDWFPTIISLIRRTTGQQIKYKSEVDGVDQSGMLLWGGNSNRREILHQLNGGDQAIRIDDLKLIVGNAGEYDGYADQPDRPPITLHREPPSTLLQHLLSLLHLDGGFGDFILATDGAKVRLYNVSEDVSETKNLAVERPGDVARMRRRLEELRGIVMPAQRNVKSNAAHHKHSSGIWMPWREYGPESVASREQSMKEEL